MITAGLMVFGRASQSGWTPVIDPHGDANAANIEADKAECRQLAEQTNSGNVEQAGKDAVVGGAVGTAAGAVVGAVSGSAGTGAMIRATVGGIGSGAKSYLESEDDYKDALRKCLQNRGHTVLN